MNTPSDLHKQPSEAILPGDDSMTANLFQENPFHYERNRRHADRASFKPAITASGGPGVQVKIGGAFLVLTNTEAKRIIRRLGNATTLSEALAAKEQEKP